MIREVYENHLYSCDQCLRSLSSSGSRGGKSLTTSANEAILYRFRDGASLRNKPFEKVSVQKEREIEESDFINHPLSLYLAAAMTILFMLRVFSSRLLIC